MIDTHCHLQVSDYDADRDEVFARALVDGVESIVVPAIDEASFAATLAITSRTAPRVVCAIGVHPHHAAEVTEKTLNTITQHMTHEHVVAVGEIGLDYHYDYSPRDVQQSVFREQIRIAKRAGKPVIVHNRESDDDLLTMLAEEQDGTLHGVLHCFSSTPEMLQRALGLGLHISFTGNITFKNSALGEVVRQAPLDRIMLETDSPWMSPPPNRGKRNEPGRVKLVAEKIAEIKGMDIAEVIHRTTANAKLFFGLTVMVIAMLIAPRARAQDAPPPLGQNAPPLLNPPIDSSAVTRHPDTLVIPVFYRLLGVGMGFGTSTVQPAIGGTGEANLFTTEYKINYMFSHAVGVDFRYWHFVNSKSGPLRRIDVDTVASHRGKDLNDYYNSVDLGFRFVFNPRNRITIGGLLGGTVMMFNYPLGQTSYTMPAFYFALTFGINLQFDWGLLQPNGEYRVVKQLTSTQPYQHGSDLVPVLALGVMYYFPEGFHYK